MTEEEQQSLDGTTSKNVKKSSEIYAEIIDQLSKNKEVLRRAKENRVAYVGRIMKNPKVEIFEKKFKIEELFEKEKHKRNKSILNLEGNYLRFERSNNGFILLMTVLSNCIEYLIHKFGLTFYELVNLCYVKI